MKMGKKVKEFKSGDFIFAKVKGYPAWPARVQRQNGKKYFVYFYGTGETANLPPNMIFDYAENKDKFLNKTVKRKDFNDGVRQIQHDFANNVPLEEVIGVPVEETLAVESANDTVNDTTVNDSADETAMDTSTADDTTAAEDTTTNTTSQNDAAVEDSDETGALVIDEGKQKSRKSKTDVKTPATPKTKEVKTPRGRLRKEENKEEEEEKKDEELVSRSGRKIRPKRYLDEQTDDNATLPSPASKKRRAGSPPTEKDKEKEKEKDAPKPEKLTKHYNAVTMAELEDLKEPYKPDDTERDTILIAYLSSTSQYIGIKLFQSRPTSFKNDAARLQWDKQAAANALTLKMQLEKGQITAQSVAAQLEMDLNLTGEEKSTLENQRDIEEKKAKMQFLRTEMKLVELDAKIKTCLSLDKADTEQCLKLLDELAELDLKPLMLIKHPSCLDTVKRMRAYIGNTSSWRMSEDEALVFGKQAHRIRKKADTLYKQLKGHFTVPEGLSFQEYFTGRAQQFTKASSKLGNDGMDIVHEPLEMSVPTAHLMKSAVEAANEEELSTANEDEGTQKKKAASAKSKKSNNTPSRPALKRQSSRKQQSESKDEQTNDTESHKDIETTKNNEEKSAEDTTKENEKEKQDGAEGSEDSKAKDSVEKSVSATVTETTLEEKQIENSNNNQEKSESTKEGNIESDKSKKTEPSDSGKEKETEKKEDKKEEKKEEVDEPRAKRSRESKKTEPPTPRSPAKRKSKP